MFSFLAQNSNLIAVLMISKVTPSKEGKAENVMYFYHEKPKTKVLNVISRFKPFFDIKTVFRYCFIKHCFDIFVNQIF